MRSEAAFNAPDAGGLHRSLHPQICMLPGRSARGWVNPERTHCRHDRAWKQDAGKFLEHLINMAGDGATPETFHGRSHIGIGVYPWCRVLAALPTGRFARSSKNGGHFWDSLASAMTTSQSTKILEQVRLRPGARLQATDVSYQFLGSTLGQSVNDPLLISPSLCEALLSQIGQLLAHHHLRKTKTLLNMANAQRTAGEQVYDPQPGRIAQAPVNLLQLHIQNAEYIAR